MISRIDATLINCPCVVADRHIMMKIILYGMQPIVVRRVGDVYYVLDGVKRYNAALLIGHTSLPCIVKEMTDKEACEYLTLKQAIELILSRKTTDDWSI